MLFLFDTEEECDKFTQIYAQYHKPLYYAALEIMRTSSLAQEAVQDTFLKISKMLDKLDVEKHPQTYAYLKTTLKRVCYQKMDQENRQDHADISELKIASDFQIEEDLLKKLDGDLLKQFVKELKPEYQLPLIYKYYFDYSDRQIADMLQISSVNVSVRIVRAKKKLLQMVKERRELLNGEIRIES